MTDIIAIFHFGLFFALLLPNLPQKWAFQKNEKVLFFPIGLSGFFSQTGEQQKGGNHLLYHSTTSICPRTFRYLFTALHVRWLLHIFNRNAFICNTATRWDLPPYRVNIWLIDDVMLIFVFLLVNLILAFVTAIWNERNQWSRTRINYHPCITSERLTKCASHPNQLTKCAKHLELSSFYTSVPKSWLYAILFLR